MTAVFFESFENNDNIHQEYTGMLHLTFQQMMHQYSPKHSLALSTKEPKTNDKSQYREGLGYMNHVMCATKCCTVTVQLSSCQVGRNASHTQHTPSSPMAYSQCQKVDSWNGNEYTEELCYLIRNTRHKGQKQFSVKELAERLGKWALVGMAV